MTWKDHEFDYGSVYEGRRSCFRTDMRQTQEATGEAAFDRLPLIVELVLV